MIHRCRVEKLTARTAPCVLALAVVGLTGTLQAQVPAFPGALGFGANATGGRNGTVVKVTNLNDSGAGSFREAVSSGNRTVVFDVGGYITLNSAVQIQDNITVAGQTAPGGIGFKGGQVAFSNGSNIVCRFIRVRPGSDTSSINDYCLSFYQARNIICDHVSVEFGPWDNIGITTGNYTTQPATDITIQNSIIANPIYQQFGAHTEVVGGNVSWIYNIFANSHNRNPQAKINTVFINNLSYNNSAGYTTHTSTKFKHDIVNNYFVHGPASGSNFPWYQIDKNQSIYYTGNLNDSNKDGVLNGSTTTPYWYQGVGTVLTSPWSSVTPATPTLSAEGAYRFTLSGAGAMQRDEVDALLISQIKTLGNGPAGTGAGTAGPDGGLYDSQTETGLANNGYGVITGLTPAPDTDADGMPDFWEVAMGLNPNVPNPLTNSPTGYTPLEDYLNWMAAPHAATPTSAAVVVALTNYCSGFSGSASYVVSNAMNGSVSLVNGNQAQFTPTPGFNGLGRFDCAVSEGGVSYIIPVTVLATPGTLPGSGTVGAGAVIGLNIVPPAPPDNLTWRGDGVANLWNTSAQNWFDGTNNAAFSAGDYVRFDDSGSNSPAISLTGTLTPGAVVVDSAQDYTFGGSGALSGPGALSKYGSGMLTIGTVNSGMTGMIDLAGGVLSLGGGASLGSGTITIRNNSTLDLVTSGLTDPVNPVNIPNGEAATITSGSLGNEFAGAITGGSASMIHIGGSVSFKQGPEQFSGFPGTVVISNGELLRLSNTTGSNGGNNTTFVVDGTLEMRNEGTTGLLGALTGSGVLTGEKPNTGTITYNVGAKNLDTTFAGTILDKNGPSTNTALVKVGSGQLTLTGLNPHTGTTTVTAGTLLVNGTNSGSPTVVSGGILGGTGQLGGLVTVNSGGKLSPGSNAVGTLNLTGGLSLNSGSLAWELGSNPAANNDQVLMQGGVLTLSGTETFLFSMLDGQLGPGIYSLVSGGGNTSGSGTLNHNLPGSTRQSFSLQASAAGSGQGYIQLTVSGSPASLVWAGTAGSAWDLNATANWLAGVSPSTYYNLDLVRFDDSSANGTVTLSGSLYPGSLTVSNGVRHYTFEGPGALTGPGILTKQGTGTLTLNNANPTYSGVVNLAGGTTSVALVDSLGTGLVNLMGGATLDLAGSLMYPGNILSVPAGQSGTLNSSGGLGNGWSGKLVGDFSSVLNITSGVSFSDTTSAQFDGFLGTIHIQPGATLRFSHNGTGKTFGSLVPTFIIDGTLRPRNAGNLVQLGALSGAGTIAGPQSNAGSGNTTYFIGGNNVDVTFDGEISSETAVAGSLVELNKIGSGTLTLNGASTYTGGTTVSGGTLRVNNATGSGTGTGSLIVESGATLAGTGIVGSPTTLDEGSFLAPGNGAGTLTFSSALDLSETSTMQFELGTSSDLVVVNGELSVAGTLQVAPGSGFGVGSYTLFSYNAAAGLNLGAVAITNAPAGYAYSLSTNTPGELNLIVVTTAPPGISSAVLSGGNLIVSGTNGVPDADYYVLSSTNLVLPVANWEVISTNQFDGLGHFTFTNAFNPATPQRFFRLQVP